MTNADLDPGAASPVQRFSASGAHLGVLAWRVPARSVVLSSAPVGGGARRPGVDGWILNVGVAADFARRDLDAFVVEVADAVGLDGSRIGLLTAARVHDVQRASVEGVVVDATVGIGKPTWAADRSGGWNEWRPGTINLVVQMSAPLSDAALVNAVITATEAKTQALLEAGVPGTGTASDAVVIVCPPVGDDMVPIAFCGPRAEWGARLALAVHQAVAAGIADSAREILRRNRSADDA